MFVCIVISHLTMLSHICAVHTHTRTYIFNHLLKNIAKTRSTPFTRKQIRISYASFICKIFSLLHTHTHTLIKLSAYMEIGNEITASVKHRVF